MILQTGCNDFGGAGREVVDEHYDFSSIEQIARGGLPGLAGRRLATIVGGDDRSLMQK